MRTVGALVLLAGIVNAGNAQGFSKEAAKPAAAATVKSVDGSTKSVEVKGSRIHSAEILGASAVDVDLGPSPPVGSSRLIERFEIERAYETANATLPKKLPSSIKVTRKTRRLTAGEVANLVRGALDESKLGTTPEKRGTLQSVRASGVEVPADFDHVTVALQPIPRRAGVVSVPSNVAFIAEDGSTLFKSIVPIEIALPPEAAHADIARGQPITLVIRRGLVEVAIGGTASADADVGSVLQVMLKPSGHVVRARAVDHDHAVALED